MVVVSGTMTFGDGVRDQVVAAMQAVEAETAKEEGCITYRFYPDRDDPNTFRVFEEWSSWETLGAHAKSAHLGAFRETLKSIGLEGRDIKAYTVSETKQL